MIRGKIFARGINEVNWWSDKNNENEESVMVEETDINRDSFFIHLP